jgi:hypothetical protein
MKNTLNVPLIFSRVWARCAHPSFSTRVEEHQGEEKNNYAEAERRRKKTRGTKQIRNEAILIIKSSDVTETLLPGGIQIRNNFTGSGSDLCKKIRIIFENVYKKGSNSSLLIGTS